MDLDQNNSSSVNLGDGDSHNALVTTHGSTIVEAFYVETPIRDNPSGVFGVPVCYPARVCDCGYVDSGYGNDPGSGFRSFVQTVQPLVRRATYVSAPSFVTPPIISTVRYSGVKLWCRFGGKIMRMPLNWTLIYVGGDSKIVSVSRNVSLNELFRKVAEICGEFFVLKYQVPEGGLDELVSVVSTDDLEGMMFEYDRWAEKSSEGIPKLKVFLFSPLQLDLSAAVLIRGSQEYDQRYIEELQESVHRNDANITRTESMVNVTFMQNSYLSGTESIDSTGYEKVEEVKGIVDGNGGGVTRKESMASVTSMQNSDGDVAIDSTGHEQVDSEEVKGMIDGIGDGATRRDSMATATSVQETDLSRTEAIDSTRPEQVDIEEVKGIVDENGGGITRKESRASAPMQISDLEGTGAIDIRQGDISGTTSSGGVSHKNNFTTSQENARSLVCLNPNPPIHVEPATDLLGIQAVSSHSPVLSAQPIAAMQPQQQQVGLSPSVPYFQDYADPQKEVLQYPSQLLVNVAPVFTQHQKHDNVASVTPNLFISRVQMPMTPNSSDNARPTAVHPVTEAQQVQPYQKENMYGQGLVQISGDQSYSACHAQVSHSSTILGGCGWHQAPQIEQVPSALLRTHSDTLAQGQRESLTITSNFSPVYHSLQPGENIRGQPASTTALTATLEEGVIKNHGTEAPLTSLGHIDHEGRKPEYGEVVISQYVDDRTYLQRDKSHNHLQASVQQSVVGASQCPNSVVMGTTSQLYQENVSHMPVVLMQNKAKEEVPYSTTDRVASVGNTSFQVSDHLINNTSREHSGKLSGSVVSKEGTPEPFLSYDQLKQINSGMENLGVRPSEVALNNMMSSAGNSKQDDIMHNKAYPISNREPRKDNVVFMGTAPRLSQENVFQKPVVLMQHKAKEDTSSQFTECLVHKSSKEHSGKIDTKIEDLGVRPSEVVLRDEQVMMSAGNSKQEDIMDNRAYQISNREPHMDNVVFMGAAPQLHQENVSRKLVVPTQHKPKEEVLYSTAASVASVEDTYSQVSDHLHDSSKEQSGKLLDFLSKEGMLEPSIACDQFKQIDSRMENLVVRPSVLDNKQMNEVPSCPSNEVPYSHNEVLYSNEVTQPPLSGIDPAPVAKRSLPSGELDLNASQCYSKVNDAEAHLLIDGNNYYISPVNRGIGDMQDNSNSLISREDPQNLQHDTHIPPPGPNEILTRKEARSRDPSGDNRFGSSGESAAGDIGHFKSELLTEDGVHLPSVNLDADYTVRFGKGSEEEHIKQELHDVAEGIAASAQQTCIPLGSASQDSKLQSNDEVLHANKAEDMKSKFPVRANRGFPLSDELGRLQIIKYSDLEELRELGSGTIGTVYYGKWRGSDVAIKRINDRCFSGKPFEQERMREDFWNEAIKLADLHHPNVVAFYGVAVDGPGNSVVTVTEYMINGSLRTVLHKNEKNLDMQKRLLIAKEVAFGMEYLHGKNIVHFDLKSDNLLVNLLNPDRPVCKVGDLGLSKVKRRTLVTGGMRGTLPWMAPELLDGKSSLVSEKVDVYSFGIVLWELLTGDEPYKDLRDGTIIGGIANNTLRPPVHGSCDPEWRSLMERCWSAEPSERPNFTEIVNQLQTMEAKFSPKVQTE